MKMGDMLYLSTEKFFDSKLKEAAFKISQYPFIEYANYNNGEVEVIFNEPVDLEGQDVLEVFYRGGAIKKRKDKEGEVDKDDFILIEPIGSLL